ncbi:two component response regulator with GGDEF domain [Legionella beliardensis]|uniref:diguanylate cyclase n=1 Tax=Legionella beliardensis TaxID=91822 RepID=A0A378I0Z9_9GAMM|nr:GGDEF domain-containing protein [Legionella beliardensis]STX28829.1 two component response regulator with GGDEF domain [Legionella beliardensis]
MKRKTTFRLQDECFLLLLQNSLKSIPFNIFLATFIWGYLLYRGAPSLSGSIWYSLMVISTISRWINSKQCITNQIYILNKRATRNRFLLLTFITGSLWGLCYVIFYPYFSAMHQNVITLVLGGMAAGGLASLSVYTPAYYAYLFPMFLPLIIYNYWLADIDHILLATMFVLFVVMLVVTANYSSYLLQETIQLTKEKDKALKEVQRVSITDALTGLYNRRYFDERLNEEFRRAKRDNHSLNLILIDVDDFKNINDNYGHPSGDLFLKDLANEIKVVAQRASDTAFRIGGDEFAAILSNTSLEDAIIICNKMQKKFKQETSTGKSTISIGIVGVSPVCADSVSEIISAADKTLYEAKKSGKNQIRSKKFNC